MKTVVVTGAAKGLGLSISRDLVGNGYFVVGIGRNRTDDFDRLPENQRSFHAYDLQALDGIQDLVRQIFTDRGQIYGLVNNAGMGLDGVLATQHKSDIANMLTLNLEAPITLAKYTARYMIRQKEGRIVNITSIIASTGFNGLAVYAATKAGLEGFTRSLSRELGRVNVTVNAVAPGYMMTEMTESLDGEKLASITRRAPLGLATTEDAAGAVTYLMSEQARKTSGIVLTVDGGSTA